MRFFDSLKMISQAFLLVFTLTSLQASATLVEIQTVMGNIEVNLFDKSTPKTVNNFLTYAKAGSYANSIIHRSIPGFIIQGGGYNFSGSLPLTHVAQNSAITNEPVFSNKRGTIALAKLPDNVNSATNQWFINLADNSANLDVQNGGFSVFGQVNEEGMIVVDAITKLYTAKVDVGDVPLRNYTAIDFNANKAPNADNFVLVTGVIVKDATVDTTSSLSITPTPNTLLNASSSLGSSSSSAANESHNGNSSSSGGGIMSYMMLALLTICIKLNKSKIKHV